MTKFSTIKDFRQLAPFCLPGGICGADDWFLLQANAELRRLLNISPDASPGAQFCEWLAGGIVEKLGANEDNNGRLLVRRPSGEAWLLSWRFCLSRGQILRAIYLQELPLAELKLALFHRQREIDSILDFIHDGIWIIDGNGITLRINRAMERIAGIRAEEVVGRHVCEPLREGRFKTCVTLRALKARRTVTLFDDYSNGKRCLNTSTPVFDASGNVWRVIAAIRDITELEDLQKRLSNLEVEALAYRLRAQGLEQASQGGLLGQSLKTRKIQQEISKAAQTDAITLILGETGTGKTLAAKAIHELSARASKPFVTVNCGAIPASLMESEIFGYEKGAFTGALKSGKPGMLELASGGTLLFDEIGELSLPLQAKLLHILDGDPVFRVGGTKPIMPEARIIVATNRNLEKMVSDGAFREDLFYRLRVLCVKMPALRDRKEDILLLTWHFLHKFAQETGRLKQLTPQVEKIFLDYAWPGNVRELQGLIQSLATLCVSDRISVDDLPPYMRKKDGPASEKAPVKLADALASLERDMLAEALAIGGSSYKAALRLGISQSSVVRKARKYGFILSEKTESDNHETRDDMPQDMKWKKSP